MDELFRFNITRAVERSDASSLQLNVSNEDVVHTHTGPIVFSSPSDPSEWIKLESEAVSFIVSISPWLFSSGFQTFTGKLKSQLADLRALPVGDLAPNEWPAVFRKAFEKLAGQSDLKQWDAEISKLFVALLILRRGGPARINSIIHEQKIPPNLVPILFDKPSLSEVADLIRFMGLLLTEPSNLATMTADEVQAALAKTLLVPPGIFSTLAKPVRAVGFADLYLVKQHIHHYELGEIARIENILKGETRGHSQKHFLSNEKDTSIQTDNTTETDQELTTTDHVNIKNEIENTLKEDTKVDGGLHIQYDGSPYKAQTDLTAAYDQSSSNSQKTASEIAKDVTQKAAKKVTQRIQQSETIKIIETFEEDEDQAFDNKSGSEHISGIYQWVEKVYLAQVFNYGRHMLFDITVPEPAASLLAAASIPLAEQHMPVPPDPLGSIRRDTQTGNPILDKDGNKQLDKPLQPLDLSENDVNEDFYGYWVAKYGVTGVEPPPQNTITVSKAVLIDYKDDNTKQMGDAMHIDDGYGAYSVTVSVDAMRNDGEPIKDVYVDFIMSGKPIMMEWTGDLPGKPRNGHLSGTAYFDQPGASGSISFTVYGPNIEQMAMNIELTCIRLPMLTDKWKLQTYEQIFAAWQKLQSDYEDKMAARQFQRASVGPLGATNPETNRQIERTELKRASIAILDNQNVTVRGVNVAVQTWPSPPENPPDPTNPPLPEPVLPNEPPPSPTAQSVFVEAEELGARVRWFEQAFEWDKIGYIFYPYFWGRRSEWLEQLNMKNDDPLFQNFLQAGYARVVIPVRNGFEDAVNFYLLTGQPWMGGDLPKIGDAAQNPLYLSITEELKAQTGAPGDETPVGDPWYIRLPTTLIKLRKDDERPTWVRVPKDITPPDNPWTWIEGAPEP